MMDRGRITEVLKEYQPDRIKVGALAGDAALGIADGAVEEGFRTIIFCEKGREKTYATYFKSLRVGGRILRGAVDGVVVYEKLSEIMSQESQMKLRGDNVILVPNSALTNCVAPENVEDGFEVPILGSRNLLRTEMREDGKKYYELLDRAGLPHPQPVAHPKDIESLVIVKLNGLEREGGQLLFTAGSSKEYTEKSNVLIKKGRITKQDLKQARIEKYIIGPVFDIDFFYSPLEHENEKLELLGASRRFETSIDGHARLPALQQITLNDEQKVPEYATCGHGTATLSEGILDGAFQMGEKYVGTAKELYPPGIIGAFCLRVCIDKDLAFHIRGAFPYVSDGTGISAWAGHPYGNMLWRRNMSTGRRTAMELRRAIEMDRLGEIIT